MPVTTADGQSIDVHTIGGRVALVVDGTLVWLEGGAVATLRHKLTMAMRAMDTAPAAPQVVEMPKQRQRWLS